VSDTPKANSPKAAGTKTTGAKVAAPKVADAKVADTKTAAGKPAQKGAPRQSEAAKPATKRENIRRKVAESRGQLARAEQAARKAPERLAALTAEYPFAVALGAVGVGLVVGMMIPRVLGGKIGGRLARNLGKRAAAASAIALDLGLAYGRQALEQAGEAAGRIEDASAPLRESVSDGAVSASRRAAGLIAEAGEILAGARDKAADLVADAGEKGADAAGQIAGSALAASRGAGHKIAQQAIRLRSHLRH
jgi:ElaB/YqjD/DUF883 family membrane-anchored ribosome-binding protein